MDIIDEGRPGFLLLPLPAFGQGSQERISGPRNQIREYSNESSLQDETTSAGIPPVH
jgi:hypothetical protein